MSDWWVEIGFLRVLRTGLGHVSVRDGSEGCRLPWVVKRYPFDDRYDGNWTLVIEPLSRDQTGLSLWSATCDMHELHEC